MMGAAEEASCLGIALLYDSNFAWDQHKVMTDGFLLGRCLNNLTWSDERVKVGLARPLFPDAQSVLPDEAKAAALAYSHLKAQGLNHFACYRNLDPMLLEYQYLEDAFLEIADSELCFRNGRHVKEKWSLMRHFLDLKDWLESLPKPIGILCSDEEHALRLMRVVNDSPYSIPDDIALMAYGVDLTQGSGLGISGVDPNSEEVGARGIRELHRLMNGGKPTEEPVMIPPRGVRVSLTTDRRFSLYPLVRTVIQRFEQSGFARKSVQELASDLGVSKTTLNLAFRKATGNSIADELRKRRLDHAVHLLQSTSMSITQIAFQIGYDRSANFSRDIKSFTGKTPKHIREEGRTGRASQDNTKTYLKL